MDTVLTSRPGLDAQPGAAAVTAGLTPSPSAVSWGAILAGAATAAAATLVILSVGSGLGFASVSPWSSHNPSPTTVTVMTGVWLILTQWLASALGGYMAGRLRTRAVGLHTDESFFRDTAHGMLAWAAGTLLVAGLAAWAGTAAIGKGVDAASTVASGAATGAAGAAAGRMGGDTGGGEGYGIDTLFRTATPDAGANANDARAEAARIVGHAATTGELPAADRTYLAQLVAARTGVPEADAQKRVDDLMAAQKAAADKARDAANTARKAASAFSLFTALSLLVGAFIASVAGALGGRLRDDLPVTGHAGR